MRAWVYVASVAAMFGVATSSAGCGSVETKGTGGTGGGGGTGGTGGSGTGGTGTGGTGGSGGEVCPATPKDAPCGGGIEANDGLRCEYDTKPCPTIYTCSSSITHGGWLVTPPEMNGACETAGQVCTYVDENFDSGQTTMWTATCSAENTWTIEEKVESGGP